MIYKLAQCPHCGKTSLIITTCKKLADCDKFSECGSVNKYYTVICDINGGGCGASSGYYPTIGQAVKSWNNRQPMDNIAERLKFDEELYTKMMPTLASIEERHTHSRIVDTYKHARMVMKESNIYTCVQMGGATDEFGSDNARDDGQDQ